MNRSNYIGVLSVACALLTLSSATGQESESTEISAQQGSTIRATIGDQSAELKVIGCPDLTGPLRLGQGEFTVEIQLGETLKALNPADDPGAIEDLCHYAELETASLNIATGGVGGADDDLFAITPAIVTGDISIYLREGADPADASAYAGVTVGWSDSGTDQIGLDIERWGIGFKLYAVVVSLAADDDGVLTIEEGAVSVQMDAEGEVQLGNSPVFIAGNTSSIITYSWQEGAAGWLDGAWDLGGFGGIRVEVRRDGRIPIAYMGVTFDGELLKGDMLLTSASSWEVNGFEVSLKSTDLSAQLNIRTGEWQILRGSIVGGISAKRPIEGAFEFELGWDSGAGGDGNARFIMGIKAESEIRVFGSVCDGLALRVDMDPATLRFEEISGRLSFRHEAFDSKIVIDSFLVSKGELKSFAGSGSVKFQQAFQLNISELDYDANVTPAVLAVNASMDLGWSSAGTGSVDVRDFKINADGEISSFRINAGIQASPVELTFGAAYDATQTRFSGRFEGSVGGAIDFKGSILIGVFPSEDPFGYGCLGFLVKADRGVPIGQSGLMLLGLHGAIGANASPPLGTIDCEKAVAKAGTFYLAGGMTVGDAGGLAQLMGTLAIELGDSSAIGIRGEVQVTQDTPYVVGIVSANYRLGSSEVFGEVGTSIKIPESGSVINISNNTLAYQVASGGWKVDGKRLGGTFFGFLDIHSGTVSLGGELARPISTMSGSVGAGLRGGNRVTWTYPDGFSPWGDGSGGRCDAINTGGLQMDCDCTYESRNSIGFGVGGGFDASLSGQLNAQLNRAGTSGDFDMDTRLTGSVAITTPASGWFGIACASMKSVSARGTLNGTNRDGLLRVGGTLKFSTNDGSSMDLPFDHTF